MPFRLDIFHPDRILVGVARGDISLADLQDFVRQTIESGALHYRKIIDVASATSSIGREELQVVVERLRAHPQLKPRGPLAIVADHQRGELARLFMALTSEVAVTVPSLSTIRCTTPSPLRQFTI